MKKILLLATAALMITSVSFADGGKKKNTAKGKTCSAKEHKECKKDKEKNKPAKI